MVERQRARGDVVSVVVTRRPFVAATHRAFNPLDAPGRTEHAGMRHVAHGGRRLARSRQNQNTPYSAECVERNRRRVAREALVASQGRGVNAQEATTKDDDVVGYLLSGPK